MWKTADSLDCELLRTPENAPEWNRVCAECHSLAAGKIKLENFIPVDTETPMLNNEDTYCQFLGKELWVEYDGSYQICCCPSTLRDQFGDFGNAQDLSPIAMWNGEKYREFIANWGENDNCKQCNMRIRHE